MLQHIIITQFSYRGVYSSTMRGNDPLKKSNLEHRFRLFEMTCLPSILQQENQDFKWVLIIDSSLKPHYRNKLEKLISGRENSFIHEYDPDQKQNRTTWLKLFINADTDYLVTTKLDDDDALFIGFTKTVRDHYLGLISRGKAPYLQFLGCNDNVLQWDYFWSKRAPLGYVKPWGRLKSLPSAAGYSLCVKYPEIDFTFFSLGHHLFNGLRNYLRKEYAPSEANNLKFESFVKKIQNTALQNKCKWNGQLLEEESFHILKNPPLQVVMANHIENTQYKRIFENAALRIPVDEKKSFPGMAIDFNVARANIYRHKKSFQSIVRALFRTIQFSDQNHNNINLRKRVVRKYKKLKNTIGGIRNFG